MTQAAGAAGRRILIHLGMPKTGTTVLQNALHHLTPEIAPRVVYPDHGRDGRIAHHRLVDSLRTHLAEGGAPAVHAQGPIQALLQEPRFTAGATAVISSESFTNLCGPAQAAALGDWIDAIRVAGQVDPVIFLREMTSFLESMYLQSSRFGHVDLNFAKYLEPRLAWFRNISQGMAVLERHGVEVACTTGGYDVLAEFDRRLDLPAGTLRNLAPANSTAKLGHAAQTVLAHLDRVSRRLGFAVDRRALLRLLAEAGIPGDRTSYTLFAPGERETAKAGFDAVAAETGLAAYAVAYADAPAPDQPFLPLKFRLLDPAVFDWLAAHRDRLSLAERPRRAKVRADVAATRA